MSSRQPDFRIYPSLLDCYQDYLDAERNWEKFYGGQTDPKITVDEYEAECRQNVIDKINRVPYESEAADKGTAFNLLVDSLKDGELDPAIRVEREYEKKITGRVSSVGSETDGDVEFTDRVTGYNVSYKDRVFYFPLGLCLEFARYYKGAASQVYTEGILPTRYGDVLLYGFIDELMPDSVHDIKTTKSYKADKYLRR